MNIEKNKQEEGKEDRRPGSDLLFQSLSLSTISVFSFHVRVRNGIGWDRKAITTGSSILFFAFNLSLEQPI